MKKIGVLGCGYVGRALTDHFVRAGHQLFVTTRKPERLVELNAICHQAYLLRSTQDYLSFLKQLDLLFITVAPESKNSYRCTYLETVQIVGKFLNQCPSLKQIIYTSSTSVYGDHQGRWVDETTVCCPLNETSQILLETENQLISYLCPSLKIVIFRLGEIIGPGRSIAKRLQKNAGNPFLGDGHQYTNLTQLHEIILAATLAVKNNWQGIYNLCNELHISRKELYNSICQRLSLPSIEWNPNQQSLHGGNKRVNSQKIKDHGMTFDSLSLDQKI